MKRVAFVIRSHAGSLFPLMKCFLQDGYIVDCYCLHSDSILSLEASDFVFETKKYGLEEVPISCYPLLNTYFDSKNLHIYSFKTQRPFESHLLFYNLAMLYRYKHIRKFCNMINKMDYDCINVVGRYHMTDLIGFLKVLKGNLMISLHEVCNHRDPDFRKPKPLVKYLIRHQIKTIVYSQKSFNDILCFNGINSENVKIIPFGKFETYKYLADLSNLKLPDKYVLFIGSIDTYKGLDLFYNATSTSENKDFKYVVAGAGNSEYLNLMEKDKRYLVINKFLSVYEFADLVKNAGFIVCPYKSCSQSGIPVSSYVFNIPIIASDLQPFKEMISDNEEGMLFHVGDETELKSKLEKLMTSPDILLKFHNNLQDFEIRHSHLSWNTIYELYKTNFLTI